MARVNAVAVPSSAGAHAAKTNVHDTCIRRTGAVAARRIAAMVAENPVAGRARMRLLSIGDGLIERL